MLSSRVWNGKRDKEFKSKCLKNHGYDDGKGRALTSCVWWDGWGAFGGRVFIQVFGLLFFFVRKEGAKEHGNRSGEGTKTFRIMVMMFTGWILYLGVKRVLY